MCGIPFAALLWPVSGPSLPPPPFSCLAVFPSTIEVIGIKAKRFNNLPLWTFSVVTFFFRFPVVRSWPVESSSQESYVPAHYPFRYSLLSSGMEETELTGYLPPGWRPMDLVVSSGVATRRSHSEKNEIISPKILLIIRGTLLYSANNQVIQRRNPAVKKKTALATGE